MTRSELALRLLGIGWYIGFCIVLGAAGGLWLDGKLHTKPLMVIVGTLLGVVVAFYGMYKMILPLISQKRNGGKK
jgi:F0F1-type ATP synthase assembly protein I